MGPWPRFMRSGLGRRRRPEAVRSRSCLARKRPSVLETFFNGEVLWRAWPLLWEGLLPTVQLGALPSCWAGLAGWPSRFSGSTDLRPSGPWFGLVAASRFTRAGAPHSGLLRAALCGSFLSAFASMTLALAVVSSAYLGDRTRGHRSRTEGAKRSGGCSG